MEELDTQELISSRIDNARLETRQLYSQIEKAKNRVQDTTLKLCSKNIEPVTKINLKPLQILRGHNNKVADMKWSSDSKSILSCSQDGFLILWDPVTGLKLNAIPLDSQWVLSCAISPNSKFVASAGLTNNCTIYSIPEDRGSFTQRIVSVFKGHVCGITACDFVDSNSILTASGDMTCCLWDIPKSSRSMEFLDHFGDVLSMSINKSHNNGPNDTIFATGASDGHSRIFDTRTSKVQQSFFVGNSDVTSVKFFKDGNLVATGCDDGIIRLFDLRADCELGTYALANSQHNQQKPTYYEKSASPTYAQQRHSLGSSFQDSALDASGVTSLDFSNSGRLMFSTYSEQGCVIWDTLKGAVVGKLEGHSNRVANVATAPNGLAVCTSSWDSTMRVWTPSYV